MNRFDPVPALRILVEQEVRFVVIGGVAAIALGSPSLTGDLDICYARDRENLQRLAGALREMEAELRGVDDEVPFLLDARMLEAGDHFTFRTRHGDFDVIGTPAGTTGYDDLERTAVRSEVGDVEVLVASIEDLMSMKRAAGRPKDRVELEILGALRDVLEEES